MKSQLKCVCWTVLAIVYSQPLFGILAQEPVSSALIEDDGVAVASIGVESFDITQMQERLKTETGMSVDESRTWLVQRVWSLLGGEPIKESTASKSTSVLGVQLANGKSATMQLDAQSRGVLLVDDELIVTASPAQLASVEQNLETMKQFGFRQIVVQTHVFRDSVDAMKKLPLNWSLVEAATRIAEVAVPEVQPVSFARSSSQTTAGLFHERQQAASNSDVSIGIAPPKGVTSATWTEATSVVERATPVMYSLLTSSEYQALLNAVKKSTSIDRVMSPTVVVFNGQVATISDSVERPFVTGVKPVLVGTQEKKQVDFTPIIRVYPEGTTMKIRPELQNGVKVRLTYQLDLCKVRDVQSYELPSVDGRGKFTVQMPEVASTQFRTCLDLPIDHTLAVSAFETDSRGNQRAILVLCRCTLSNVESKGK